MSKECLRESSFPGVDQKLLSKMMAVKSLREGTIGFSDRQTVLFILSITHPPLNPQVTLPSPLSALLYT